MVGGGGLRLLCPVWGKTLPCGSTPRGAASHFIASVFFFHPIFFGGGGQAISVAFLEYVFNSLGIGTEVEFENK